MAQQDDRNKNRSQICALTNGAFLSRRALLKNGALLSGAAFSFGISPALADDGPRPNDGSWQSIEPLPIAAQGLGVAPFWRKTRDNDQDTYAPFNILVAAGGQTADAKHSLASDRVFFLDPEYNRWGVGKKLPHARHHLALVNNNGLLYAVGGYASNKDGYWQMRRNCWQLDKINGRWKELASFEFEQAEAGACAVRGIIHYIGGRTPLGSRNLHWRDHTDTDKHLAFDPAQNRWHARAPLPSARHGAACTAYRNTIYVIGGRTMHADNVTRVDVYDPFADRWSPAKPLPVALSGASAVEYNNEILVTGGVTRKDGVVTSTAHSWAYSPQTDNWRAVKPMAQARHDHGAAVLNNGVFAIGGTTGFTVDDITNVASRFDL